ncbi:SDR family oxidoreductase [Neolewinella agarilytica]|uniref:3-oxoacyl-[acyl-carrier protein] reductase n=1 Tax=Neolewinella agarilytica TaxID=478744 RepID=A0A1H9AK35_9BACT|nr:SDR family NAD(P)-dependent oxidoreductase [Neolewinella agarilytica]SEP77019.1 3-oxoacyl-[acyl-carrier protein] reductase [Neolewinella agarilytica]
MKTSKLTNKYALVTGGSRGIGRATCIELARMGYNILINYNNNAEAAAETAREVNVIGQVAECLKFDISDEKQVDDALNGWIENNPDSIIEILVNNAGLRRDNLFVWINKNEWESVFHTNVDGFYHVSRRVLRAMIKQRYGRIVTVVSMSGLVGPSGQTHYAASKAALIAATKSLSKEVGKRNVTVNSVAPGFIRTEMIADINEETRAKGIPVKRFGEPEEVASLIGFLCSKKAGFITGENMNIDGGGMLI